MQKDEDLQGEKDASPGRAPQPPEEPSRFDRLAILGLGLIGGSVAMGARAARLAAEIVAFDPDAKTLAVARDAGVIDQSVSSASEAVRGADVVLLAAPVRAIVALLDEIGPHLAKGCLVLDLGSTKQKIITAMDELPTQVCAVGGHPMAGKEVAGLGAAEATLFDGAVWVLCESARTDERARTQAEAVVRALGARPLWVDAVAHDEAVARISQLPYALSATLAHAAAPTGLARALAAGGYRDTGRRAGSDPTVMLDIFLSNQALLLPALADARHALDTLHDLLASNDIEGLRAWMEEANAKR